MIKGDLIIKESKENPLTNNVLTHTFTFLDLMSLTRVSVNKKWHLARLSPNLLRSYGFQDKNELNSFINQFPVWIRKTLIARLTRDRKDRLTLLLSLSPTERLAQLYNNEEVSKINYLEPSARDFFLSSPLLVIIHVLDLNCVTTVEEASWRPMLFTDTGIRARIEGLITIEQAKLFYHSGGVRGPNAVLDELLVPNGLIALREKLITPEQARNMSRKTLRVLFSDIGMKALRTGLITAQQAGLFYQYNPGHNDVLNELLVPNGLIALVEKLITPEQACAMSDNTLRVLFSDIGMKALRTGLITTQQAGLFYHSGTTGSNRDVLCELLVPNGLIALKEKLITPEQACKMTSNTLRAIFSDIGMGALKTGLITAQQAGLFYHSGSVGRNNDVLRELLVPNGLVALKEKLITPEQACKMSGNVLSLLLLDIGLEALRAGLITIEKMKDFYYNHWALLPLLQKLTAKNREENTFVKTQVPSDANNEISELKASNNPEQVSSYWRQKIIDELSSDPEKLCLENENFEDAYHRNKGIMDWLLFNLKICPKSHRQLMLDDLKLKHPYLNKLEQNFLQFEPFDIQTAKEFSYLEAAWKSNDVISDGNLNPEQKDEKLMTGGLPNKSIESTGASKHQLFTATRPQQSLSSCDSDSATTAKNELKQSEGLLLEDVQQEDDTEQLMDSKDPTQSKLVTNILTVTSPFLGSKKIVLEFKRSHGRTTGDISTRSAINILTSRINDLPIVKKYGLKVEVVLEDESAHSFKINLLGVAIAKEDKESQKNLKLLLLDIYYAAKYKKWYLQDEFIMRKIVSDFEGDGQVIKILSPPKDKSALHLEGTQVFQSPIALAQDTLSRISLTNTASDIKAVPKDKAIENPKKISIVIKRSCEATSGKVSTKEASDIFISKIKEWPLCKKHGVKLQILFESDSQFTINLCGISLGEDDATSMANLWNEMFRVIKEKTAELQDEFSLNKIISCQEGAGQVVMLSSFQRTEDSILVEPQVDQVNCRV